MDLRELALAPPAWRRPAAGRDAAMLLTFGRYFSLIGNDIVRPVIRRAPGCASLQLDAL